MNWTVGSWVYEAVLGSGKRTVQVLLIYSDIQERTPMHTVLSTTFTPGSAVFLAPRAHSSYGTSALLKEVLRSCGQGEVVQVLDHDLYKVRFKREGCGFFTMLCDGADLMNTKALVTPPSSSRPSAGF